MKTIASCIIVLLISLIAGATVFRDAVMSVIHAVAGREDSSHGLFVPLFTLYFLWIQKDQLAARERRFELNGLLAMGAILVFAFLAKDLVFQIQFILFICFVLATLFTFLGRSILHCLLFPILFLSAATPIPENLYLWMANLSRTVALGASLKIVALFGIPYFRNEWTVQLPTGLLLVNIGCSGIRYLISYVVFSIAYAYLFKTTITQRVITILSAVPISISASIFRLTAIFTLSYYVDPRLAEHRPHIVISWIVFIAVMLAAIAIDMKISRPDTGKSKMTGEGRIANGT